MLVGENASGASVPAEHAVALACALRDHLVACCQSRPDSAEAPKQRKKRKQKAAPASDTAQVGLDWTWSLTGPVSPLPFLKPELNNAIDFLSNARASARPALS